MMLRSFPAAFRQGDDALLPRNLYYNVLHYRTFFELTLRQKNLNPKLSLIIILS